MIKQIFLPLILVAVFITAVGMFVKKSPSMNLPWTNPETQQTISKVLKIESVPIDVEIANTEELRAKGLSGRTTLPQSAGMLFVFDSKDITPTFWMKDMKIDIDIIWIDDEKIVRIDKNVPAPMENTPDNNLARYTPGQPVDYILEVGSGFCDRNGIKVGESVTLPTL